MHNPKRYFLKISQTISGLRCDTFEDDNGMYVDYDDYALLKAEVDRLEQKLKNEKSANANVECTLHQALRDARRQVERLTKAGDSMTYWISDKTHVSYRTVLNWIAAKEGNNKP